MDDIDFSYADLVYTVSDSTEVDGELEFGTIDTNSYGNGFDGQTDSDGTLTFEFESGGGDMQVYFDAFDMDYFGEIVVLINGEIVGAADDGFEQELSPARVTIDAEFVNDGVNTLQFVKTDASDGVWGVTNIAIQPQHVLRFGEFESEEFGNLVGGALDVDGSVTFKFFPETLDDMTLYVHGMDIDFYGEVEVFLNGVSIGLLNETENNGTSGSKFDIESALLNDGTNEITFQLNGSETRQWGVTNLILLDPDINVSTMELDPEFSDDGYAAWMKTGRIFLGKYDTNSGALLEVLNVSNPFLGTLKPLWESLNGPELLRTSDGMSAIGIGNEGLIYLDEDENYIIPGSEGYRVGFLPKGTTDGLVFTMIHEDNWINNEGPTDVFLYDNGDITLLDLGGPTARAVTYLNATEVAVFADRYVAVYDIENDTMVRIANNIYEKGYSAALESSTGQRIIATMAREDVGEFYDLFHETETGWELLRRITIPDQVFGRYLYSPELIEWQGRMFLSGISSELPTTQADSAVVFYDIENDTWSQVSQVGDYFDPEVIALENDTVAFYYRDSATATTQWFTAGYDEIMAIAVPGSTGGAPTPVLAAPAALQSGILAFDPEADYGGANRLTATGTTTVSELPDEPSFAAGSVTTTESDRSTPEGDDPDEFNFRHAASSLDIVDPGLEASNSIFDQDEFVFQHAVASRETADEEPDAPASILPPLFLTGIPATA